MNLDALIKCKEKIPRFANYQQQLIVSVSNIMSTA